MKKLSNEGWSLGMMIGFLCVLVGFIILVSILAYRLGIEDESVDDSSYNETTLNESESLLD